MKSDAAAVLGALLIWVKKDAIISRRSFKGP